jgi:hypothetical protein
MRLLGRTRELRRIHNSFLQLCNLGHNEILEARVFLRMMLRRRFSTAAETHRK